MSGELRRQEKDGNLAPGRDLQAEPGQVAKEQDCVHISGKCVLTVSPPLQASLVCSIWNLYHGLVFSGQDVLSGLHRSGP